MEGDGGRRGQVQALHNMREEVAAASADILRTSGHGEKRAIDERNTLEGHWMLFFYTRAYRRLDF